METPTCAELHDMVRKCLWRDWDPIGVNEFDAASDEYDSYAPTITAMLLDGADAFRLRRHLQTIETDSMGLSPYYPTTDSTVNKLLAMVGR